MAGRRRVRRPADFNNDNTVNIGDYNLLYNNFGRVGAEFWGEQVVGGQEPESGGSAAGQVAAAGMAVAAADDPVTAKALVGAELDGLLRGLRAR